MRRYLAAKHRSVDKVKRSPHKVQSYWFDYLINHGRHTKFGSEWNFSEIKNENEFAQKVPVFSYSRIKPYIERAMCQERDVLWPGKTNWFSQSSGTTEGHSKYLPVTVENLKKCHVKGFTDAMAMIYDKYSDAEVFTGLSMTMGGSMRFHELYDQALVGDVSAIILAHMHAVGQHFYALDKSMAFIPDWGEKLERLAHHLIDQKNITLFGGVPTWNIVLFNRMLDITGYSDMTKIWPKAKIYVHGGVGFEPYKKQFTDFFPRRDFLYQEIYNSSEGFFAAQDLFNSDELLLMLDAGIYYEFLPISEINAEHPKSITLKNIIKGEKYALIISTNAGLWRYMPGDVVEITNTNPYRIKIVGRTKHYINAFGEEVIVDNSDQAVALACKDCHASIIEYTVAPVFFEQGRKARHEWAIEFSRSPSNLTDFQESLDLALQSVNSDYQAKRYKDLALIKPKINVMPHGTFHQWMKSNGKYGAQNKIPRLSNSRQYINEVLQISQQIS